MSRIHPDYQTDHDELHYLILDTLRDLKWPTDDIDDYMSAQQTAGLLRPGLQPCDYRSARRKWPQIKPTGTLTDPRP